MKGGWRYSFLGTGALCVTVTSAFVMPLLCAASWDIQLILIGGIEHLKGEEGSFGCNQFHALDMKLIFFSAEEVILDFTFGHLIAVRDIMLE